MNRLNFTRRFIKANANPNRRDADERSPLYWAIKSNNVGAVKLLLSYSVMESYSYSFNGQRLRFQACDYAKKIRKEVEGSEERAKSSEILRLLRCRTFPF